MANRKTQKRLERSRPSRTWLMFRMFVIIFIIMNMVRLFWNTLSDRNMLPFNIVFWTSVVMTVWFTSLGWLGVTVGSKILLDNDPEFHEWKKKGGRPFWDGGLPWPINNSTPIERMTGLKEPKYTNFTPPENWRYQCPTCGSRVEKAVDVCWNCNYGANNDDTAYRERWGEPPTGKKKQKKSGKPDDCKPC
jgi:hypothetical protein